MQQQKVSNNSILFLTFLLGFVLCTSAIGQYPITILDEAKNAEAAREMFAGGQPFFPTFNGELRTDKPPLHYLFMQLGFSLFGVNTFAARFFSGLLGGLLLVLFFYYVQKFTQRKLALWASFVLISSLFWVQEFHLAVPDPYFIFFLTVSWLGFYDFFANRKKRSLWLFYVGMALAILSKGPVALFFSGLIAVLWLAKKRQLLTKQLWAYQPILGLALILLISVPWFVWMHSETQGAYTEGFFLSHNLERFTSEMEGHGGTFLLTWLFVILGLFPLGLFLPQALVAFLKDTERNDFFTYSCLVALVVVGFFSISSTRLPNYTLPAIPFLSVLLASYFQSYMQEKYRLANTISFTLIILVLLALPVAVYAIFQQFYETFDVQYVAILGVVAVLGSGLILYAMVKKKYKQALLRTGLLWMLVGLYTFYFLYPRFFEQKELVALKNIVVDSEVKVYKSFDPALAFRLDRTFPYIANDNINRELAANQEILILSKDKFFERDSLSQKYEILWEKQTLFEDYKSIILKKK